MLELEEDPSRAKLETLDCSERGDREPDEVYFCSQRIVRVKDESGRADDLGS